MSVAVIDKKYKPELTVFEDFADEWGPEKVVYVYEPQCGLKGIVVVDNSAIGPGIGGIRMTPTVSTNEVFRLARAMTWKNALAGIPHGGAKSGIVADPRKISIQHKEVLVRQFARAIKGLYHYIPGPDMGTDETCMAWVRDEIGRSVGLSTALGGIPLDQVGATGYGLAVCAEIAQEFAGIKLAGARFSMQGFGNVGQHASRFLVERGAVFTVATDLDGTIHNENGIDVEELVQCMREGRGVSGYSDAKKFPRDAFLNIECDIFVPAAQPDVITEENADQIKCKLILQGANIPCQGDAERILHERGILSVPDFVANAGGVICGAVEYRGGTKSQAFSVIAEKMRENTRAVLTKSAQEKIPPREAGLVLAKERVREAMSYRRSN